MMQNKNRIKDKISQFLSLLICLLLIAVVSIRRDGKVLGHAWQQDTVQQAAQKPVKAVTKLADGTFVVNTTTLAKDITGFGGNVPLEIYIKDGTVKKIKPLKNSETPEFFSRASALLTKWNGKSIDDALAMKVDGVSGATYSSRAIIGNVTRGLNYAGKNAVEKSWLSDFDASPKAIAALIVALLAAILPLFVHNKRYRIMQQVLNIGVLGFWSGTFLSYSAIIGWMSNGINVVAMLASVILLIMGFVYPLFGKKTYYCTNVCPYGALQELAGRVNKRKWRLSGKLINRLNTFRSVLWAALMLCLLTGVWADWVNYEPFSAFIFQSASWVVIVIAVVFVVLSLFIMRPYCRFVCPMGTLLKLSQNTK